MIDALTDFDKHLVAAGIPRMANAGISEADMGVLAAGVAFMTAFDVLSLVDEGHDPEAGEVAPGWVLIETDTREAPTGRHISGLHESLIEVCVARPTVYRWYDRCLTGGPEALADKPSKPERVWNRIPDDVRAQILDLALDAPGVVSPRARRPLYRAEKLLRVRGFRLSLAKSP